MPLSYQKLSPSKVKLYIAGKISRENFRELIIPRLSSHQWGDPNIQTESYEYLGPYTVNCKHGCFSGNGTHESVGSDGSIELSQKDVIYANMRALESADLVFAYINTTDCYGTLMEIGWAIAREIYVVLMLSPDVPVHELWFIAGQVNSVHYNVRPCCLKQLINQEIKNYVND